MVFDADAVRGGYDAVAAEYGRTFVDELEGKALDRWLLERIVASADGGPILDAGCGPGHVAGFLAASGATDVTGFDLSPAMVTEAQRRFPDLTFIEGDLFDPPAHPHGWAAIVAPYSIVHLLPEELPEVFAALHARLRDGGRLLVACHCGDDRVHLDEWMGHEVSLDFVFHQRESIVDALIDAGLAVDEVIVRSPYEGAETPTQRLYVLGSAPA